MRYTWTVNDPSGFITGQAASVGNGYPLSRNIIQQLTNSDTDAHEVIYTLTPHSIRGDSTLRCTGTPIDVTIWVEPTSEITAEADTICNEAFTDIDPQSANNTTRGMRYTWTVNDPSGFITGQAPSVGNGYPLSRNIIQQLSNSDTDAHEVIYTLTPHSIRGDSTLRCAGTPIDVTIWVEPALTITAEADTLCNEGFTNIDPQSVNTTTRGMRYTWTVNDPSGFISGQAPSVGNGYPLSRNLRQQLTNSDTDVHEVIYTITPHSIRGDSTLRCAGTPIDVTIWVEPTLAITAEPDTLCNEDFTNIDPQSVNNTTRGMRYTWTVNDPSGFITGEAPSVGNGYPLSRNIIQQLSNSDTDAHEVIYTLTPHSIRGDSTLRCAGTPIDVTIWVEPALTITAEADTLCNEGFTDIDPQSVNTTTRGMRYTWTVNDPSGFISGQAPSVGNGYPLSRNIIQQLSNSDTDAHEVIYTITPHSIRGDSTLRCAGTPIDVTIWVEPALAITAEADTLCNEDFTNIDPQSVNTTTRGMRYTWTVNDPSGFITGKPPQ